MKKKLSLEEMQSLQLSMAREIHRICEENNIKYFMVSGTLLGAVRHKGFIPWDYDIDLGMLREDYDKFVSLCKTGVLGDELVLINNETYPAFEYPITRIGKVNTYNYDPLRDHIKDCKYIYIDIIPFDNIPDDEERRKAHKKKISQLRMLIYYHAGYKYGVLESGYSYGYSSRVLKIKGVASTIRAGIVRIIPLPSLIRAYDEQLRLYDSEKTSYCGALSGRYDYDKEAMPSEYFEKRLLMQFEDTELWGLEQYDKVLKHLYNDYMKLPPKEDQYTKFDAYVIDDK